MANEGVIIKQKTFYPKEVLKNFEKEIGNTKFYYDFLIEQGAWVINEYHPHGAVKNPEKYAQLVEEFDALQGLRYKRQQVMLNEMSPEERDEWWQDKKKKFLDALHGKKENKGLGIVDVNKIPF